MAIRMHVLFAALVLAGVVTPGARAQLGGITGLLSGLNVTGIVYCSLGNSVNATTPVFINAAVQLRCGGNVVGTATTNSAGLYQILTNNLTAILGVLLGSCDVAVTTPLASCNVNLPTGGILVAALSPLSAVFGMLNLSSGIFKLVS